MGGNTYPCLPRGTILPVNLSHRLGYHFERMWPCIGLKQYGHYLDLPRQHFGNKVGAYHPQLLDSTNITIPHYEPSRASQNLPNIYHHFSNFTCTRQGV